MSKRRPTINYTSRDYSSIRKDLLSYAKRYYPDTYRDFSEASFGSLMIDTVSYVGDILSFYLDYQANESFLDTAIEYDNIIRLGRQLGYKFSRTHSSVGTVSCFIIVPALSEGLGPNRSYIPILQKGSVFATARGNSFTLVEDINFSRAENEVVVAAVNPSTGVPNTYAIKAYGKVVSGTVTRTTAQVGNYERFKKINVVDSNITEIISVTDSAGHEYFEVDYLSQNTIYKEMLNTNSDATSVPNILKPVIVPRRFVAHQQRGSTTLQFGYGSESTVSENVVTDPSDVILDVHGRSHVTDPSFDPSKLIESDKFGIVPSNTTLTIVYRRNSDTNANAAARTITQVGNPLFRFTNRTSLVGTKINNVISSLEVENEDPVIGDVSLPNTDELKTRIFDVFATQNRAVTRQDYRALVYSMPQKFGAIKRCNIVQDHDSFKRNLNLYIMSSLRNGQLAPATKTLKENLKLWLNRNRMINDTIDILDAKVVNLQINFVATANLDFDRQTVLANTIAALRRHFSVKMDIGENLSIADIKNEISKVRGISGLDRVRVRNMTGGKYSSVRYKIKDHTSPNGKFVYCPENVVFEIKYLFRDIRGAVK